MDRYTVISADCHAGADLLDYRPFLEARYHDAFDDWAASFVSPYGDLVQPDANRNWDSTRRMRELEADGVVDRDLREERGDADEREAGVLRQVAEVLHVAGRLARVDDGGGDEEAARVGVGDLEGLLDPVAGEPGREDAGGHAEAVHPLDELLGAEA